MLKNGNQPYSHYVLLAIAVIKQTIDDNPLQFKTASELIRNFVAPHRNSLEKAFKVRYGFGIKEYQVKQRLEASKKFLESGMNKKQVAAKCFYSGQSSFCRAFKKEFDITPTEWQNLYGL